MWLELITGVIATAGLLLWLAMSAKIVPVLLRPRRLGDVREAAAFVGADGPRVSVIVPACNEAAAIEKCLESLAAQDYRNLEIIAINDRSTDETGVIMDRLAARHERIRVIHIDMLPAGWLGKNHANYIGATQTEGTWLLFTDGDIIFQPDAIGLAVAHVETESLDHLCLMPGLLTEGYWETAVCCFFGILFSMKFEPWHVRNPSKLDSFCGIGAFNLVRRSAYEAIGTHERLRLEVGDDVKLGKLLKHGGKVCDALAGWPHVTVRWQVGLRGVVRGLEKNGFCGADYKVLKGLLACGVLFAVGCLPLIGTIFFPGWARGIAAVWMVSEMAVLGFAAVKQGFSPWVGLGFPVAGATLDYAIFRSMVLALWRGGIQWRGTFYSLEELRQGLV